MTNKIIIIKNLFKQGYTSTMVANIIGMNPKNINYYIKRYNIEVKNKFRKYHINDTYFDNIDSEIKAYLLGFFIADGYLANGNRICINNSIDDIEVISKFKDEICPESKIIHSNRQLGAKFRKEQITVRFTSNYMYNILYNKYKIIQNKTQDSNFSFNFNNIPIEFHRDFIRGFFDGDGSVSFYKTKNTIFFNFSFIFNSNNFSIQIGNIFKDLFNIEPIYREIIGKTCSYYTMRFNYYRNRTEKIKDIYDWLYKDSNIFLSRKREKFNNYLEYRANSLSNINEQCNA